MATINFARITPAPDASAKTTPLARSSHGISAVNDGKRLVVYGGEHVARTPITEAGQVLWLAEKTEASGDGADGWQWISPADGDVAPSSRVAHAQASVGDAVYVFGGRNGIEMKEQAMNDLWKLEVVSSGDERSAKWTEVTPAGDLPEARSFHKMIAISTDLYMFGGCGISGRLNDLWKFDTVTEVWTNLGCSQVLKGRGGPNILPLAGKDDSDVKIAIVAGFAGEETNDGHIFNNSSWEAQGMDGLADLRKRSVCSFGALPHVDKCLIFGGEVDPSCKGHEGAGNFDSDVALLDGSTGALSQVIKPKEGEAWPEARGWADAAVGGDTFYLFGGLSGDDADPVRLDDLWGCHVSK